ncbi:hypothetical protein [Streptomyces xanthii]|uniref:Uncharacterized protein n=1 Tax=Streptomyces xanthii TaxID=2768069 RepID=A0A7H1B5B6_9ACTN|nr:hypothetical protein [Streptomyces xanthii]QNS03921.1 hypothetical protein IAG42_09975 [Streptomyces xanthii]
MTDEQLVELGGKWTDLVRSWARSHEADLFAEDGALCVQLSGRPALTLDVSRAGDTLVVAVTDGGLIPPDRLAPTAAAALAWNSREASPAAVLGDARSEAPLLSAVATLPTVCHMSEAAFRSVLDTLVERSARLLRECHDLGFALRGDHDLPARK